MFLKQFFKVLSISILLNSFILLVSFISISSYIDTQDDVYEVTHINIVSYLYSDKSIDELVSKYSLAIPNSFKKQPLAGRTNSIVLSVSRYIESNLYYIISYSDNLNLLSLQPRAPPFV
jgi:hypothetical protein